MPLTPSTHVGPYEIVGLLGAGGMGEVYRAHDTKLGRDVALKVLPALVANDPDRLARFRREAQVLASLNDPHIAQIYGFEDSGDTHALVMELVEGPTLDELINRGHAEAEGDRARPRQSDSAASRRGWGPAATDQRWHALRLADTLAIARQMAAALETAHERGIVHRDLKPANVKVRDDGTVKVLDFGLAKAFELPGTTDAVLANSPTVTAPTAMGTILGAAAYMAPEQARGQLVDKRADIWAFGVVLFEMLTGRQLFTGETVSDTLAAVLRQEIDWTALPADTPARVRQLLRRCLDRDPKQRLRDIGEARVLLSEPDIAADASVTAPLASPSPSRAWRWLGVAAAILLAAAVGAGAWWAKPSTPIPLRRFDLPREIAANGVRAAIGSTVSGAALAPDGASVAYVADGHLYVRALDALSPRDLGVVPSDVRQLFWSPDSRSVGFAAGGELRHIPAAGSTPFVICTIPATGRTLAADWLPSGSIVFAVWRDSLYQVAAAGGAPTVRLAVNPATEVDFHDVSALPDGRLLLTVHHVAGDVYSVERLDGTTRRVLTTDDSVSDVQYASGHLLFHRSGPNSGLWAVPFTDGPIDLTKAVSVQPGAEGYSVSRDGSLLVGLPSAEHRVLVWVDRSGRSTPVPGAPVALSSNRLALSPDGHRAAFVVSDGDTTRLVVRDMDTGLDRPLTTERDTAAGDVVSPATWLPTGDRLAYASETLHNFAVRILEQPADGSTPPRDLTGGTTVRFSRDGRTLVGIVDDRGRGRLRYARVASDGTPGPLQPIFQHDEPDAIFDQIALSPDGSTLAAAARDPDGRANIFLTRVPSGIGRWAVTTSGGTFPAFSADGRELFYEAPGPRDAEGSAHGELMRVPITLQPSITIGVPTALFGDGPPPSASRNTQERASGDLALAGFSVSPDGQRFLMSTAAPAVPGEGPRVVLVQNWVAGLRP